MALIESLVTRKRNNYIEERRRSANVFNVISFHSAYMSYDSVVYASHHSALRLHAFPVRLYRPLHIHIDTSITRVATRNHYIFFFEYPFFVRVSCMHFDVVNMFMVWNFCTIDDKQIGPQIVEFPCHRILYRRLMSFEILHRIRLNDCASLVLRASLDDWTDC